MPANEAPSRRSPQRIIGRGQNISQPTIRPRVPSHDANGGFGNRIRARLAANRGDELLGNTIRRDVQKPQRIHGGDPHVLGRLGVLCQLLECRTVAPIARGGSQRDPRSHRLRIIDHLRDKVHDRRPIPGRFPVPRQPPRQNGVQRLLVGRIIGFHRHANNNVRASRSVVRAMMSSKACCSSGVLR